MKHDPREGWTDEQHENSLAGWLFRRTDRLMCAGTIQLYVNMFKRMWAEQFGDDRPIPQYIKDRVTARVDSIKSKEGDE